MSRLSRLSTTFALVVAAAALTAGPAPARTHDHDRMPDKWEKRYHLNVKKDDSRRDRDRDGLSNYGEYRAHTNPRKKDSDHDGRRDSREDFDRDKLRNAAEIKTGFDPRDKDSDDDGVKDGRENAGKIVTLSGSSITIKLAVGGTLTARLGDELLVTAGRLRLRYRVRYGRRTPDPGPARTPIPAMDDELPADDGEDTADPSTATTRPATPPRDALRSGPGQRRGRRRRATTPRFDQEFGDDTAGADGACQPR